MRGLKPLILFQKFFELESCSVISFVPSLLIKVRHAYQYTISSGDWSAHPRALDYTKQVLARYEAEFFDPHSQSLEIENCVLAAAALDPRTKHLSGVEFSQVTDAWLKFIRQWVSDATDDSCALQIECCHSNANTNTVHTPKAFRLISNRLLPMTSASEIMCLFSVYEETCASFTCRLHPESLGVPITEADNEILNFSRVAQAAHSPDVALDPVLWWKERAEQFPLLSRAAKALLAMNCTTSMTPSNMFTTQGLFESWKRQQFSAADSDVFVSMLSLHDNWDIVADRYDTYTLMSSFTRATSDSKRRRLSGAPDNPLDVSMDSNPTGDAGVDEDAASDDDDDDDDAVYATPAGIAGSVAHQDTAPTTTPATAGTADTDMNGTAAI